MLDRSRAVCAVTVAAAALTGPLLAVSGASGRGDHGIDHGNASARVFATGEQLGQNAAQSPGDSGHHDGYSGRGSDGSGSTPGQTAPARSPAYQAPAPAAQAPAYQPPAAPIQAASPAVASSSSSSSGDQHSNHDGGPPAWAHGHSGSGRTPWAGGHDSQGNSGAVSAPSASDTASASSPSTANQSQSAGGAAQASRASQASQASTAATGSDTPHHDSVSGSGSQSSLVIPGSAVAAPATSASGSTIALPSSSSPTPAPTPTPSGSGSSPSGAPTNVVTLPSRLSSLGSGKNSGFHSTTAPVVLGGSSATAGVSGGALGLGGAFGRGGLLGTSGTGATPTLGAGGLPAATGALGATGTSTTAASRATGTAHGHSSPHSSSGGGPFSGFPFTETKVFDRFVNVIPDAVWIALAASLALAALGAGAAVGFRRQARRTEGHFAAVEAAALTDPLTGVLNRRGFTEAVERELARARRYHRPFVLAYVDVRGLKAVNDTEGHLAGDELLKTVAGLLTESARADDVVGRLGGDELGLLLAEQTAEAAAVVTRRIEAQVPERSSALGLSAPWGLTIGTAAFPQDGETFDQLIGTADRRLYEQRGIALRS